MDTPVDKDNLGPLTTVFTPPPESTGCSTTYWATNSNTDWIQRGYMVDEKQESCLPSGWEIGVDKYFSPGICPSGHEVACQEVHFDRTTGTCCPPNYTCKTNTKRKDAKNVCQSTILTQSISSIEYAIYTGDGSGFSHGSTLYVFESGDRVDARGVIIRREDGDPTWAPAAAISTTTSSIPAATSTGTTSLPAPDSTPNPKGATTPMGSNAKTGIGLGVSFGVVLLAGCMYAAYKVGAMKRRKQRNNKKNAEEDGGESKGDGDDDDDGDAWASKAPIPVVVENSEGGGGGGGGGGIGGVGGRHEMHDERKPGELMHNTEGYYPIELDAATSVADAAAAAKM